MATSRSVHELTFCARVKSWADALFAQHPEWPFHHADVEEQREDLRVVDNDGKIVLCGEVKMPGTPEGQTPYDPELMRKASQKADDVLADHFFTWNVRTLVLFDRTRYRLPMIERRVKPWSVPILIGSAEDCGRPDVEAYLRERFLPEFFAEFASILRGERPDWGMSPDDIFIRSLESHLEWPVFGTADYLAEKYATDKPFAGRFQAWMTDEMQWTFDPRDPEDWRAALERAAKTLCYVFCNRAIFYEAIRARYPETLKRLRMPTMPVIDHESQYDIFRKQFQAAVRESGDYEPVFYPEVKDWAGALIFASSRARQGWNGVFANLAQYDFREIPRDVVGKIFQKLISPEERQKFGQFFTSEDIIDVIDAFCIRHPDAVVLDPACGSGSFLVRAYHRKAWLCEGAERKRRKKPHLELLHEVFGCDIALFPAHLATLNLAARHIEDEENYPYIARGNFFEVAERTDAFWHVPGLRRRGEGAEATFQRAVPLPPLDAVVGNPPYVRQEAIPRRAQTRRSNREDDTMYESRLKLTKEHMQELCSRSWNGLKLSGRSDLHCYFWPVAAALLKEGGYFGFLTSSSWLDVEYGFPLQGWILNNFRLVAVIESVDEPWFEDARVKTAVTILQRCSDMKARDTNVVKFVRLQKPLAQILGNRPPGDEGARQTAAENLRNLIEKTESVYQDERLRIIPVPQHTLYDEGVRAGLLMKGVRSASAAGEAEPEGTAQEPTVECDMNNEKGSYYGGKWGRFLRAPDFYFRLMRDYGHRFVKLGEIADIRFGIKSGCDAFFMPHDVTEQILSQTQGGISWLNVGLMTQCKRSEVVSGKVRIVRAGDNTIHPIEAEYLRPEVHSLMQVDRPVIRARDTNRVVLWVNKPLKDFAWTYVAKYIKWGARQIFASKKSEAVPVPQRSTVAARPVWYDLTGKSQSVAFWPMTHKYRHVIPANPERLVCNHRLFYVFPRNLKKHEAVTLPAILNSTVIGLVKHFFGRYAGSEGTLDTEVVDCVLLEIPDPRGVTRQLAAQITAAFKQMSRRKTSHLVDDAMLQCHSEQHMRQILARPMTLPRELQQPDRRELDSLVLEMIGVQNVADRAVILDELYEETARYYRYQRTQDIQAMENRAVSAQRKLGPKDLAASIWDSLTEVEQGPAIIQWLGTLKIEKQTVEIPEGEAVALGNAHLFDPSAVVFGKGREKRQVSYGGPEQAALVSLLASLEIRGEIDLPTSENDSRDWVRRVRERLHAAREKFETLAASRTGTEKLREQTRDLLMQWYIHGRPHGGP